MMNSLLGLQLTCPDLDYFQPATKLILWHVHIFVPLLYPNLGLFGLLPLHCPVVITMPTIIVLSHKSVMNYGHVQISALGHLTLVCWGIAPEGDC